jgi:putative membrane protein insertion efficiency factor
MIVRALLGLIRLYQIVLSPLLGEVCRFHPSCSRYAATCLERFGVLRGSYLAATRLCRCHRYRWGRPAAGAHPETWRPS